MTAARTPELVAIPGGEVVMGKANGRDDERPPHRVTLAAFRAASRPVTNAEYAAFVAATGHDPAPFLSEARFSRPAQPAVGVSWPRRDCARGCLPKRNGSTHPSGDSKGWIGRGAPATTRPPPPSTRLTDHTNHSTSAPTGTGFVAWPKTSTNGAATGTRWTTTGGRLKHHRRGPRAESAGSAAAEHGGTRTSSRG